MATNGDGTLTLVPDYDRSPAAGGACTSVLALRHGESEWNAVGRWQGQADPPLTDAGMLQAAAAAKLLGSFDAIFASTLQRAADTAAIIAESLGVGPVQLLDDLQENAFGSWQGLTISEIEAGWPGYLAAHRRPEDAETADAVVARGLRALHTIAALQPRQQALVITHAGLLRTMRRALIQTAGIQTASIPTGPGSDDPALPRFSNLGGCWFHVFTDGTVTVGETVNLIDPQSFGDAF